MPLSPKNHLPIEIFTETLAEKETSIFSKSTSSTTTSTISTTVTTIESTNKYLVSLLLVLIIIFLLLCILKYFQIGRLASRAVAAAITKITSSRQLLQHLPIVRQKEKKKSQTSNKPTSTTDLTSHSLQAMPTPPALIEVPAIKETSNHLDQIIKNELDNKRRALPIITQSKLLDDRVRFSYENHSYDSLNFDLPIPKLKGLRNNDDLDNPDILTEDSPDIIKGSLNLVNSSFKISDKPQMTKSNTFTIYYVN